MIKFFKKLFAKSQAEIKLIPNKDIQKTKPKYVFIKKGKKLVKFKVVTNSFGMANLIEVKE